MSDNEEQIETAVQNKAAPQTTIWDELNEWGEGLHNWQRFILCHAVRDTQLSSDRVEDAYRLFLRHAELDIGTEEIPVLPPSITGRADLGAGGALYLLHSRKEESDKDDPLRQKTLQATQQN